MNNTSNITIKKDTGFYIIKHSCILCGIDKIDSGKIFKGHCICEACHKLICSIPTKTISDINSAAEAKKAYIHY